MSDLPERGRPRPETLARRRQIVEAATEIFGGKGFSGGTLQDVADRVGMTHAGVLHHFGSKEGLLLAVLSHRDETGVAGLEGRRIPAGAGLFRHLIETARLNEERPGIVQAFTVLSAESVTAGHPAHDFFVQRYRGLRTDIAEAFRVLCSQCGLEDRGAVGAAAASIAAVMDGLQIQWLLDPDSLELAETTAFAIGAIVDAVIPPPRD